MPGARTDPPVGADEATAVHRDPPTTMVRETMLLGINIPVGTGTDEAVPPLARTLSLSLGQRQDQEAIRLWEGPLRDSVARRTPFTKNSSCPNISRRCLFCSFRPPRRRTNPHRVDLDDMLKMPRRRSSSFAKSMRKFVPLALASNGPWAREASRQ